MSQKTTPARTNTTSSGGRTVRPSAPCRGPVRGKLGDQVVDARCRGQARAAGDGSPPLYFAVGDRAGQGEDPREVFLRDDDEAAGVAADHIPGTDDYPAALHDDV